MSSLFCFVGQCGNQLGLEILNQVLYKNDLGFSDLLSNTVLLDSEPKVVEFSKRALSFRSAKYLIPSQNIISGKQGRGCNWALGYNGIGQEKLLEETLEASRRCAERCSNLNNIMMIQSLCGGTGGGLGSRLLEALRDTYPLEHIINCVVAPYESGESPLQYYNQLLTLASLQKFSDAVILFKNNQVQHSLSPGADKSVSISDINGYIANCISGLISPTDTFSANPHLQFEISEIIRSVCPDPSLKFLTCTRAVRRNASSIVSMLNSTIAHMKHDTYSRKCFSLSNLLVARGSGVDTCLADLHAMESRIKRDLSCVPWNPFPLDVWTAKEFHKGADWSQVTLLSNYSNVIPYSEMVWNKSQMMYQQKAFLHWFQRHGISEEYFDEAFQEVCDIHTVYTEAVR